MKVHMAPPDEYDSMIKDNDDLVIVTVANCLNGII